MSDNLLLPASNAFKHKDEQFPVQASIDALRAAIVSRNGLLESISEQIRRGFEASTGQQNAAAARAENLAIMLGNLAQQLERGGNESLARLAAIEKKQEQELDQRWQDARDIVTRIRARAPTWRTSANEHT